MGALQDKIKANKEKRFAASIAQTKDRFGKSAFTPSDADKAYLKNTLFGEKGPKNAKQNAQWARMQSIQGGDPQNKSDLRFYKRQLNKAVRKEANKIMTKWTSSDMSVKDASKKKAFGTSIIKPEVEQPSNAPDHAKVIQQIQALEGDPTYDYNKDLALLASLQQQQSEKSQNQGEVVEEVDPSAAEKNSTLPGDNLTGTGTTGIINTPVNGGASLPTSTPTQPLSSTRPTASVSKGNKINFDYFKYF